MPVLDIRVPWRLVIRLLDFLDLLAHLLAVGLRGGATAKLCDLVLD